MHRVTPPFRVYATEAQDDMVASTGIGALVLQCLLQVLDVKWSDHRTSRIWELG